MLLQLRISMITIVGVIAGSVMLIICFHRSLPVMLLRSAVTRPVDGSRKFMMRPAITTQEMKCGR